MDRQKINVIIVEDNPSTIEYLRDLISGSDALAVHKVFDSAEKALPELNHPKALWLIDVRLPRMPGTELVARLRTQHASVKLCCYTAIEDPHVITEAIIAGANGYIIKDTAPDLLLLELETVARGGTTLTPRVAQKIFQRLATTSRENSPLATMETRVLERMASGYTYTQIADELQIAPGTARKHIENIYLKLRVHSKAEAIRKSRESGWLN
ncbi:MAG: response regulator transcription factor [Turneriella sp.]